MVEQFLDKLHEDVNKVGWGSVSVGVGLGLVEQFVLTICTRTSTRWAEPLAGVGPCTDARRDASSRASAAPPPPLYKPQPNPTLTLTLLTCDARLPPSRTRRSLKITLTHAITLTGVARWPPSRIRRSLRATGATMIRWRRRKHKGDKHSFSPTTNIPSSPLRPGGGGGVGQARAARRQRGG